MCAAARGKIPGVMEMKTHVNFIWFRGGPSLRDVEPAPTLVDDMAGLTDFFRDLLRKNSEAFDITVELEGFAPMQLSLRALCQTAALVSFHPRAARDKLPDTVCLLINGLEGPDDIAVVKAAVQFPPELWKALDQSAKPVVVAAFNVNGRLRDPATMTVIHVLGNVYFNMFGTNAVDAPRDRAG